MARKEKNKKEVRGFSSFLNNQIDFTIIIFYLFTLLFWTSPRNAQ
mgnify:CR=1 FL=1